QKDANNGALSVIVEINNPTSRVFFGSLSATTVQGGDAETKNVTVSPGKNYYTLKIIPTYGAGIGSGKVIFNSGGKQITSDYDLYQKSQIAGLFTFGELTGSQGTIGIIILMIIAVLIIIGIITVVGKTNQNKEERQAWI
ncbi:MAG: hypothetical protein NTY48_00040, partial [Candidatus Diapherotrites archaeon]|nr:hypothetical protein [Candidatus Diapherotrites archaeon]